MAEESDQDRTEPASPQRLEKAREEGQVVQSRELATFVVLMASGATLWMMAGSLGQAMSNIMRGGLQFNPGIARDSAHVMAQLSNQFFEAALALAPTIAACTGCISPSGPEIPSTVRTALPSSWGRNRMQALSAFEPPASVTITVQVPQSPSLQPSFVPVKPRVSRNQSNSVRVGASPSMRTGVPFNRNAMLMRQSAAVSP